jgi:predicted O-methyltransferase YrrM
MKRMPILIHSRHGSGLVYKSMYSRTTLAAKYFSHLLHASNGKGHGTHSPFVFQFISEVLNDRKEYPEYNKVEGFKKSLLKDRSIINYKDPGAGSSVLKDKCRTVAAIARNAAKPKKYGRLIYRIARYYNSRNILELGTSLGLSTAYLALSSGHANVISIEGVEPIAERAKSNLSRLGIDNARIITGNFDERLIAVMDSMPVLDLGFIDGNHRREPTLEYFSLLLQKTNEDSILIFDDIHWSREMEEAWNCIKSHQRVTCSIDLFFLGIVFFRPEFREKQQFLIRF